MGFQFSFEWFFGGLAAVIIGALIVVFHKQIGDHLANGVTSYDKIKLVGVIAIAAGLVCVANLHLIVLNFIANLFFGR